jgi:citrate lyase subunit beta / citryl-CoA lyase
VERPLRSWMFVPGNSQKFLDKALSTSVGVDAVFLDLEDGVPFPHKAEARELVVAAAESVAGGPMRFVRVNAVGTEEFTLDIDRVLTHAVHGICVPKVERVDDVIEVAAVLADAERRLALADGTFRIVAAIESATALVAAPEIAASHPRLLALMFGAEDYALDLGLGAQREGEARELLYARSAIVVAAAAARILSIDGVFPNLDDPEGLEHDVVQARRLGFDAKSTFNPRQVELINRVFSPAPDELEYARKVVDAFRAAQARGDGSVAIGGQLVDLPIVRRAQRILEVERHLVGA